MRFLFLIITILLSASLNAQFQVDSCNLYNYKSTIGLGGYNWTESLVLKHDNSYEYICYYCGYGMIPFHSFGKWHKTEKGIVLNSSYTSTDSCFISIYKIEDNDSFDIQIKYEDTPMSFFSQSGFPLLTSFVINESDSISYDIFQQKWMTPSSDKIQTIRLKYGRSNTLKININSASKLYLRLYHPGIMYKIFINTEFLFHDEDSLILDGNIFERKNTVCK
ncbi:MAG: hypothetical protein MK212_10170 [Saprospiraceae bacterium]|nr:hypothetical protein [Saprospiraceae bacterium]